MKNKIPLEIFYLAEAWHGVLGRSFWEKFSKNETSYIRISRCPDHFALILKSWNVLVFMLLIFQICQNLTESWHGVLSRSFGGKFWKNKTCYTSISRCSDQLAHIFKTLNSIFRKLLNYEYLHIYFTLYFCSSIHENFKLLRYPITCT